MLIRMRPLRGMLTGTVHGHAALLNLSEEVSQFIGSLSDMSGEAFRQQPSPVHKFKGDGHHFSVGATFPV